jgi:N6-adenosine-specific RNA methylase IME4
MLAGWSWFICFYIYLWLSLRMYALCLSTLHLALHIQLLIAMRCKVRYSTLLEIHLLFQTGSNLVLWVQARCKLLCLGFRHQGNQCAGAGFWVHRPKSHCTVAKEKISRSNDRNTQNIIIVSSPASQSFSRSSRQL